MERKLASIQKVIGLHPIEGADFIESCDVLGWHCVVKKGEFKPGDIGVFFEVDSLLPKTEEFSFMEKNRWRVKTVKFKGQISQGLMLPITSIKSIDLSSFNEGDDVTETIKVEKWEPPEPYQKAANLKGRVKGLFPSFIKKTDETRIQAMPVFLSKFAGKTFFYTEKLDGSSVTFYLKDGNFGVCSRNLELAADIISTEENHNAFWKAATELDIETHIRSIGKDNRALQGELIGPGIQKNKYELKNFDIYFYNVWDIAGNKYVPSFSEFKFIINSMGLKTVPIIDKVKLNYSVDDLVQLSIDYSLLNGKVYREGIVFRPEFEETDDKFGRLSFKVINPEFLIRYDS